MKEFENMQNQLLLPAELYLVTLLPPKGRIKSTKDRPPPVIQIQSRNQILSPMLAPVVTPTVKPSIPFPSEEMKKGARKKLTTKSEFYES
ncbi:hypothetical protein Tco_0610651 [Tanacetum coccineum]